MSRPASIRGALRSGTSGSQITFDTDLPAPYPRAIYTDVDGDVEVVLSDDETSIILFLLAGMPHPLEVKRVNSAGTGSGITVHGIK